MKTLSNVCDENSYLKANENQSLRKPMLAELGEFSLENEQSALSALSENARHRCFVICVTAGAKAPAVGQVKEMLALLGTLGDEVCGHQSCAVLKPNAKTFIGLGKLQACALAARELGATMLVMDAPLTGSQARNIEQITGLAVGDRTATILKVFARHARTKAARVQIEMAQLRYLRPRIRGLGVNMDQQTGGIHASKGAGETASQLLVRQLDERLCHLQKLAGQIKRVNDNQSQARRNCKQIAVIGYTNAGKTSLMNAITCAGLRARDAPFETLESTTRCMAKEPGLSVLLSDTVGFIRDLPASLLASFETTLAQITEADLIVQVLDVSDPEWALHVSTTQTVLEKLSGAHIPRFYVLNKTDLIPAEVLAARCEVFSQLDSGAPYLCMSVHDPQAVQVLQARLVSLVKRDHAETKLFVKHNATKVLSVLHQQCTILASEANGVGTVFRVQADKVTLKRLRHLLRR